MNAKLLTRFVEPLMYIIYIKNRQIVQNSNKFQKYFKTWSYLYLRKANSKANNWFSYCYLYLNLKFLVIFHTIFVGKSQQTSNSYKSILLTVSRTKVNFHYTFQQFQIHTILSKKQTFL